MGVMKGILGGSLGWLAEHRLGKAALGITAAGSLYKNYSNGNLVNGSINTLSDVGTIAGTVGLGASLLGGKVFDEGTKNILNIAGKTLSKSFRTSGKASLNSLGMKISEATKGNKTLSKFGKQISEFGDVVSRKIEGGSFEFLEKYAGKLGGGTATALGLTAGALLLGSAIMRQD